MSPLSLIYLYFVQVARKSLSLFNRARALFWSVSLLKSIFIISFFIFSFLCCLYFLIVRKNSTTTITPSLIAYFCASEDISLIIGATNLNFGLYKEICRKLLQPRLLVTSIFSYSPSLTLIPYRNPNLKSKVSELFPVTMICENIFMSFVIYIYSLGIKVNAFFSSTIFMF